MQGHQSSLEAFRLCLSSLPVHPILWNAAVNHSPDLFLMHKALGWNVPCHPPLSASCLDFPERVTHFILYIREDSGYPVAGNCPEGEQTRTLAC